MKKRESFAAPLTLKGMIFLSESLSLFLSNMQSAATQVAILYIIVLVGFICAKTGLYTQETAKKTTDLLFYIVTVAVIVKSFSEMTFSKDSAKSFVIALICNFLTLFISIFVSWVIFRKKDEFQPIYRFAAIYGNAAYVGIPLTYAILGAEGVFYASTGVIAFNVLVFIHGVKIMTKENYTLSFKKVILNPGVLGTIFGLPLFLLGLRLPEIVQTPLEYIADINTPLAMIIFGTYLASTDLKSIFKEKRIFITAFQRLIFVPLLILGLYRLIGIQGALLTSLCITSATPSANNTIMFAAKYDRDTGAASKLVATVSFISIITLPVIIALSQSV